MAPRITCSEKIKQVDSVTAGLRRINYLSTSDMSAPSSIDATLLATTEASLTEPARCRSRGSTDLLRYRSQVFGGPALAHIAESRGSNAGQPFGFEEQVKPLTVKRVCECGLGFQPDLAPFFGHREDGNLLRGDCHSVLIRDSKLILVSCRDSSDAALVVSRSTLQKISMQ